MGGSGSAYQSLAWHTKGDGAAAMPDEEKALVGQAWLAVMMAYDLVRLAWLLGMDWYAHFCARGRAARRELSMVADRRKTE